MSFRGTLHLSETVYNLVRPRDSNCSVSDANTARQDVVDRVGRASATLTQGHVNPCSALLLPSFSQMLSLLSRLRFPISQSTPGNMLVYIPRYFL